MLIWTQCNIYEILSPTGFLNFETRCIYTVFSLLDFLALFKLVLSVVAVQLIHGSQLSVCDAIISDTYKPVQCNTI